LVGGAAHRGGRREPLSKATLYATLTALKRFFIGLAGQPGYKCASTIRTPNTSTFQARIRGSPRRRDHCACRPWRSFVTTFFPVGNDIRVAVVDWVNYLRQDKLWGLDDPLFPMTKVALGEDLRFAAAGLDRKHWSSAGPIRTIFKDAFTTAGLPYFNPHSFRKTLALLGGDLCETAEHYKAWSQNLGHDHVLTTFTSYGDVSSGNHAVICSVDTPR
jgi:hypothetical protein